MADLPKLKAAGIIPFAIGGDGGGWQIAGAFGVIQTEELGHANRDKMLHDKDLTARRRPRDEAGVYRLQDAEASTPTTATPTATGTTPGNWSIPARPRLQIMGDWARGEFAAKGEVGVKDFGCMIGLDDAHPTVTTDGDVFVFPKQTDPDKEAAQKRLANLIISPTVQLAFNNAKGSVPGARRRRHVECRSLHAEGARCAQQPSRMTSSPVLSVGCRTTPPTR